MEVANNASVVGTENAGAEAAAARAAEPRRRRPRVAFHVTGFGVFNGVADNPTTHLINELPGQLRDRPRRGLRYDDYHGHGGRGSIGEEGGGAGGAAESLAGPRETLPAFGGDGEGAFEVRSCKVLHVSAEVGGRQVRELHAASLGSTTSRGEEPAAALRPVATATAAAAVAGGGGGSSAGVARLRETGDGASGSTGSVIQGKSADEGGGPGDSCCVERAGGAADAKTDGGVVGGSKDNDKSGADESGDDGGGDDDDVVTVLVHCGVNGGTDKFALETQGFNEATFRVPDEQGYSPSSAPIESGLPKEHCRVTTVPVADVLERLGALGWGPEHVAESKDAGRFVCNYVYYMSLGLCETSPAGPTAAGIQAEGGAQAAGPSEEGQRGEGKGVFCFSGAGAGGGVSGSEVDCCPTAKNRRRRHSLFIHVPPFEAVPKEKQLALLMACLSTIAAAVSSSPSPSPPAGNDDHGIVPGNSPFVTAAETTGTSTATATASGAVPAPPLSLSSYEAAVLAAGPEALSPGPADTLPTPIADDQNFPAEQAAPAAVPSIWDGTECAEIAPQPVTEEDEAGDGDGGGGGGVRAQSVVQFALAGLAESERSGHSGGDDGEGVYYRGEIGGDSGSEENEDEGEGEGEGEETPADATRRRLIAAGFDSLDVDAAMATTGSDNIEVNMGFLLDITPLLPRGAPSDADGLNLRECINDREQHGGGGGGDGDRGRGATAADHAWIGSGPSNGAEAIRPRVRPAASPAGMGGVSPKWVGDVSPVRDGTPRSGGGGGGGGGLFSRLRRGHKRVPGTASAASEAANDGEGERTSEQRASPSSSSSVSRLRSSFTSLSSSPVQQHVEYMRRTTGHVARSHSPPPARGVGGRPSREFGSGGCVPKVAAGWGELAPSGPNLRLALVVRLDLGMAPGTVAAQCSRAALAATRKAEGRGRVDTLAVWREAGESIVVLGAADAGSLDAILVAGEASHLPITLVRDKQAAWVGNVRADTCTVAAIGPAPMSALRSVAGGLTVL